MYTMFAKVTELDMRFCLHTWLLLGIMLLFPLHIATAL